MGKTNRSSFVEIRQYEGAWFVYRSGEFLGSFLSQEYASVFADAVYRRGEEKERRVIDKVAERLKAIYLPPGHKEQDWHGAAEALIELVKGLGD